MKYVEEFRDGRLAAQLARQLRRAVTRPWAVMEVCGGQTHAILRYGIDQLLPESLTLLHGPGCPVCITPVEILDQAQAIAARPGVILCSFGDMLRVPGSRSDLLTVKARGGDVRVVYSPLDVLALAHANPDRQVVFLAVGFETTAPANAMLIHQAQRQGLENLSVLVSQALVPPALAAMLDAPERRVQGFLAAGHVCAVMGIEPYRAVAGRYRVPVVVAGFEPLDILQALLLCVRQLEAGRAEVENAYDRVVRSDGNPAARALVDRVFAVATRPWRGIGTIPDSGLTLRPEYAAFDAVARFGLPDAVAPEPAVCIAGQVLTGLRQPGDCPAFGGRCTPETPLGAPMVSGEGACAAYYRYRRAAGGSR